MYMYVYPSPLWMACHIYDMRNGMRATHETCLIVAAGHLCYHLVTNSPICNPQHMYKLPIFETISIICMSACCNRDQGIEWNDLTVFCTVAELALLVHLGRERRVTCLPSCLKQCSYAPIDGCQKLHYI